MIVFVHGYKSPPLEFEDGRVYRLRFEVGLELSSLNIPHGGFYPLLHLNEFMQENLLSMNSWD